MSKDSSSILSERLKISVDKPTKMNMLAERSASGNLSSFSGVFKISPISTQEKEKLTQILTNYNDQNTDIAPDLDFLTTITSEVKAINNQAIILHGERIKQAQNILKKYRDGAFTAWLISTYGNRQTPYNFLQYYEFYQSLNVELQKQMDDMPRQVVYTLSSREGAQEQKEAIVANYQGQTKKELLALIRKEFPLARKDKRKQNLAKRLITHLRELIEEAEEGDFHPTNSQKKELNHLIKELKGMI